MSKWAIILGHISISNGDGNEWIKKEHVESLIEFFPVGDGNAMEYDITPNIKFYGDDTTRTDITIRGNIRNFGKHDIKTILVPWWQRLIRRLERQYIVHYHKLGHSNESSDTYHYECSSMFDNG